MMHTILFSIWNFWVFHVNGKQPWSLESIALSVKSMTNSQTFRPPIFRPNGFIPLALHITYILVYIYIDGFRRCSYKYLKIPKIPNQRQIQTSSHLFNKRGFMVHGICRQTGFSSILSKFGLLAATVKKNSRHKSWPYKEIGGSLTLT